MQSAKFYQEDLAISSDMALRIAKFMELASRFDAIENPTPWAKKWKVRVYFSFWSQNSLWPLVRHHKTFYDAEENDIFASEYNYGKVILSSLSVFNEKNKTLFSGSKTRKKILEFSEVFYAEKINWN